MNIRSVTSVLFAILSAFLLGCGEGDGPAGPDIPEESTSPGVTWIHPRPIGDDIAFIWGEAEAPSLRWVWGVGAQSWTGDEWNSREDLPASPPQCINAADDIWFIDSEGGPVWHYDGNELEYFSPYGRSRGDSATPPMIRAAWGQGGDCVFIAIDYDIYEFDGQEWSSNRVNQVRDLWGTSRENVYAVYGPLIHHYDGETWVIMHEESGCSFSELHGVSSDEIYALDSDGKVAHFDGAAWNLMPEIPFGGDTYWDIWANSPEDILVFESRGAIAHWDGSSWTGIDRNTAFNPDLHSCWGDREGNYWLVGDYGATYGFDGSTLESESEISILPEEGHFYLPGLSHVVARSPEDIFVLPSAGYGGSGTSVLHFDGQAWEPEILGVHGAEIMSLTAVDNRIFAVGGGGLLLERVDGQWWELQTSTYADIHCIWGRGDGALFLGGENGLVSVFDGEQWRHDQIDADNGVSGIGGVEGGEVYALASNRGIYRYDGQDWDLHLEFAPYTYSHSLWESGGQVFFVLEDILYRNSGSGWETLGEVPASIAGMEFLPGLGHVAIGSTGSIYRFDGQQWLLEPFETRRNLNDISVMSDGRAIIVGAEGTVLLYDPER